MRLEVLHSGGEATPEAAAADTETTHSNVEPTRRYPQRIRKPPDRYSSD